jgi:hypothetical protein
VFWHVSRFDSRAEAAAERTSGGTVIDAYGRVWLMTIAGADWRPHGRIPRCTWKPACDPA